VILRGIDSYLEKAKSHSFQCLGRKHVTAHDCTHIYAFKDECCRMEAEPGSKLLAARAAVAHPSLLYPRGERLHITLLVFAYE